MSKASTPYVNFLTVFLLGADPMTMSGEEEEWKLSQVFGDRCPGEELQDG